MLTAATWLDSHTSATARGQLRDVMLDIHVELFATVEYPIQDAVRRDGLVQ
jgi:hypothetical protein